MRSARFLFTWAVCFVHDILLARLCILVSWLSKPRFILYLKLLFPLREVVVRRGTRKVFIQEARLIFSSNAREKQKVFRSDSSSKGKQTESNSKLHAQSNNTNSKGNSATLRGKSDVVSRHEPECSRRSHSITTPEESNGSSNRALCGGSQRSTQHQDHDTGWASLGNGSGDGRNSNCHEPFSSKEANVLRRFRWGTLFVKTASLFSGYLFVRHRLPILVKMIVSKVAGLFGIHV